MKPVIKDTWLRIIGISLLSAMSIMSDEIAHQPLTIQNLFLMGWSVIRLALSWHLNRAIIARFHYEILFKQTAAKRLFITLLTCISATTLFFFIFDAVRYVTTQGTLDTFRVNEHPVYIQFGASHSIQLTSVGVEFIHACFYVILYVTIYQLLFYRQDSTRYQAELAQSEREKEQLRVANMQSQLDVLKQQVNPHFLFNSLNTLSSLISEDPIQAELFVDKMSDVYRYVLRSNEQHLTTVEAELTFIDAYYHLLQTRYGAGLSLTIAVDAGYRHCQLPPLSLQLLVENAVKHNIVSPKRPLHISITIDEQGQLTVENTLQRKTTRPGQARPFSNGVGLTNIMAKYQMLKLPQPIIEELPVQFIVRLPLLACSEISKDQLRR